MNTLSSIAEQLPRYDANDMPVDAVHAFLARMVQPLQQTECVDLRGALGRVLARDVVSPVNVPPHDNSAMDGYAFAGSQLPSQSQSQSQTHGGDQALTLTVVGSALAGHAYAGTIGPGQCIRIMTGAVMPAGLDTVVPQELVSTDVKGSIQIPAKSVTSGANRRRRGEDLQQGQVALASGEIISPAALGLIASLGLQSVTVTRRLRVAYFSTGDEILQPGDAPRDGAVYDSNRFTVFGLLTRMGVDVVDLGSVRDEPAALETALLNAASQADAIITSGGVSGGDADHTRALMNQMGEVAFWRIAMRPGRPMAVGLIGQPDSSTQPCVLFGLPGNPVATMVTFLAFVRPALLRMMGCEKVEPTLARATSTELLKKRPGRTEFQRGIVSRAADGLLQVRTTGNQGSGVLSSMVQANALIVLPHDSGTVEPGSPVSVMFFDGII